MKLSDAPLPGIEGKSRTIEWKLTENTAYRGRTWSIRHRTNPGKAGYTRCGQRWLGKEFRYIPDVGPECNLCATMECSRAEMAASRRKVSKLPTREDIADALARYAGKITHLPDEQTPQRDMREAFDSLDPYMYDGFTYVE